MYYKKQFFLHQTQTQSDLLSPGESLTPASTPHAELYGAKVVVEGREKQWRVIHFTSRAKGPFQVNS